MSISEKSIVSGVADHMCILNTIQRMALGKLSVLCVG